MKRKTNNGVDALINTNPTKKTPRIRILEICLSQPVSHIVNKDIGIIEKQTANGKKPMVILSPAPVWALLAA